ncbi:MAG: hypothetical protein ACI4VF_09720, partial [Lachnospirales bacterium]
MKKMPLLTIGISKLNNTICCNNIGNNHIFITGISGYGKTYLNLNFAKQALEQGISVVAIDVGNSFTPSHLPDAFKEA